MKWFKWIFRLVVFGLVAAFLAYFLPSHDIVRIVGTDVKRMDLGNRNRFFDQADSGTQKQATRDVRFIYAEWPDGGPRVYRNEDTGWSFPFYFKFNSSDIAAKAQAFANREDKPWVLVTHYGWRIQVLSMYPNAVRLREVEGPDALVVPWFNIIFLSLLAIVWAYVWLAWRRFKKKRLEPIADKIDDLVDDTQESVNQKAKGVRRLFARYKRKDFKRKD